MKAVDCVIALAFSVLVNCLIYLSGWLGFEIWAVEITAMLQAFVFMSIALCTEGVISAIAEYLGLDFIVKSIDNIINLKK